jgi:hypothetical protein
MKLGDHISYEKDGVVRTERVESVSYTSGSPAIYRQLNRWQSLSRMLTPKRWRKSLLVRPAEPASVTINDTGKNSAGKTLAQLEQMKAGLDRLLKES